MGKWCLHASLFIFDRFIIKVAGNQDRHKSLVEFDFGLNQTTRFGVTCPWVTKISHFWTWKSLKPVGKSWSNFMCTQVSDHCPLGYLFISTITVSPPPISCLHSHISLLNKMFSFLFARLEFRKFSQCYSVKHSVIVVLNLDVSLN